MYLVGVNGSIGQGKSTFSQAVVKQLLTLLKPSEGQALTRSLDDYYLPKADRYRPEFLARGYNPKGISNRGPAGTHDTDLLWKDLGLMDAGKSVNLPIFNKVIDDRSRETFPVHGQVGVFILEGWFVGTDTEADASKVEPGLKRSVASALKNYRRIFGRFDALWAFEFPASIEDIVVQRSEEEETLRRQSGMPGMSQEDIRRFVEYFYRDSWQDGWTSPVPKREKPDFWALTDVHHRFLRVDKKV